MHRSSLCQIFLAAFFVFKHGLLQETPKEELLQVQIVFRHGERAPDITFPTYKFIGSNWINGPGNLTERGRNQVKRLGQDLGKRYLIPSNSKINWACGGSFNIQPDVNTILYASKSSRSKESASILIKAFQSSGQKEQTAFDQKLIRLPSLDKPDLLISSAVKCKALLTYVIKEEFVKDPILVKYTQENKDLFALLGEKTGYGKAAVIYILPVADTLACDKVAGYQLPDWVDDVTYERIQQLAHFIFGNLGRNNELILKGSIGLLTKKILDEMESAAKLDEQGTAFCQKPAGVRTTPSITLYSAHDHTIVPLLNMLSIPFKSRPGYGAALILELWSQPGSAVTPKKHLVKIAYKNYEGATFTYDPVSWELSDLRANLSSKLPGSKEELESYCETGENALPFNTDVFH